MSIGQVLAQLRTEFPEVTISKIRFLEDQGLVEPERAPSGYRRFTQRDVARLRFVLQLQRDHYLPLRVIREHLEAQDRGHSPPQIAPGVSAPVSVGSPAAAATAEGSTDSGRLTRAELCRAAGVGEGTLVELENYGLVMADLTDGTYDETSVTVVRTASELAEFGIEPRHLRAFRSAAEREAGLVAQVVAPLRQPRGAAASGQADEVAREVSGLAVRLHAALLKSALRHSF